MLRQHTLRQLFAKDLLQYVREPTAAFFTFIFPALLLTIFASIWGSQPMGGGEGMYGALVFKAGTKYIDVIFPGFTGFVIANLGLNSIPVFLAHQRESGYFRAIQVSPVALRTVMLVRMGVYGVTFLASYLLLYAVARLVFDVQFHGSLSLFVLANIVSFVAIVAVGFLIGGLFHSPQTTQAVASIAFFLLYFSSGAAIPRWDFPDWLFRLTEFNPLTHVVELLTRIWLGMPPDTWWSFGTVVMGLGAVAFLLTIRTFKWDVVRR